MSDSRYDSLAKVLVSHSTKLKKGERVLIDVAETPEEEDYGAEALLIVGSSLTVFSGYRFVRHAAANGIPVGIVNRGPTRGDDLATVKLDGGCSETLVLLTEELPPVRSACGSRNTPDPR